MINGKGLLSPPASTSCSIFFFEILFDVVISLKPLAQLKRIPELYRYRNY